MDKTKFFMATTLLLLLLIVGVVAQSIYRQRQAARGLGQIQQALQSSQSSQDISKTLAAYQSQIDFFRAHKPLLNINLGSRRSEAGWGSGGGGGSGYQGGYGNEEYCDELMFLFENADAVEEHYGWSPGWFAGAVIRAMGASGCVL